MKHILSMLLLVPCVFAIGHRDKHQRRSDQLGNGRFFGGNSQAYIGAPVGQGKVIGQDFHTTITRHIGVPIPQPIIVPIVKQVPVPVKVPIAVPVDRPFAIPVPQRVPIPVDRPVAVAVDQPFAVAVPQPIAVPYIRQVGIPVPVPQPVPMGVETPFPIPMAQSYAVSAADNNLNNDDYVFDSRFVSNLGSSLNIK